MSIVIVLRKRDGKLWPRRFKSRASASRAVRGWIKAGGRIAKSATRAYRSYMGRNKYN